MALLEISGLPDKPSAAAARFYAEWLPRAQAIAGEHLVLAFDAADHTHTAWRLGAVQVLAREQAPARVNAIAGGNAAARTAALAYLEAGEGITGQYLPLDDAGAGSVVPAAA